VEKAAQPSSGQNAPIQSNSLPAKYTDRIFMRLSAIYGHKFTSLFPNEAALSVAKSEWGSSLAELSDFQIGQALDRCRLISDWNPNIPEFIRLATNLPDKNLAVMRVIKHQIIDPVTRDICNMLGSYELKHSITKSIEEKARSLYLYSYEKILPEIIGRNENWKPPMQIVQQPKEEIKRTIGIGEKAIADAKALLNGGVSGVKP